VSDIKWHPKTAHNGPRLRLKFGHAAECVLPHRHRCLLEPSSVAFCLQLSDVCVSMPDRLPNGLGARISPGGTTKGIEIRTQLWRRAYLPTWIAGLSICLPAGLGVVAVFRSIPASYGSIPDDVPSTPGLAPSGSAEARADDPQAKVEVARDTINRRTRTRCLKCGVVESMRQIDLSAEVAGQDTVDVKAARGVPAAYPAARSPVGPRRESSMKSRSACATAQRRC
jgi:hypothetical protein